MYFEIAHSIFNTPLPTPPPFYFIAPEELLEDEPEICSTEVTAGYSTGVKVIYA